MAKNVVGLFDNRNDAEAAVGALRDAGFNSSDISFIGNNANNQYNLSDTGYENRSGTGSEAEEGAGFGATGGAVLGGLAGLLVGLGALAIPGVGPVVAAGSLATTLGSTALGAGIGAAAGGLVGALVGAGIPENDAHVYAEGIRRGGALVSVTVGTNDEADRAASIMDRYNVVDIDERGNTYRQSGWSRFDENTEPYSGTMGSYAGTTGSNYDTSYGTSGDADRAVGRDDYDRSSKVGTAGGGLAGAATGAAIGSAGGPVGTVIGGAAGAVTGGAIGAAGDAAGAEASDDDTMGGTSYDTAGTRGYNETGNEGALERGASNLGNAAERGTSTDLDRDGDVGQRDPRNNF